MPLAEGFAFFLLPSSFFLLPSSFFLGNSRLIRLLPSSLRSHAELPQDEQIGVPSRSFFLLPSSFFLLPSAHLVLNFRDPAPPSPRGVLAYATPRRLPFRLMSRYLSSGM